MECLPKENAAPYIEWIYSIFGSCIYGYAEAWSLFMGYASIFCWLNAQLPQMIQNYKLQSADGMSLYLLYFWLAGDVGNMFSCVLNHQLPFQTYLATYFVGTDLILLFQYFRYRNNSPIFPHDPLLSDDQEIAISTTLEMTQTNEEVVIGYGAMDTSKKATTTFMGLLLFTLNSTYTTFSSEETSTFPIKISFGWMLAWICTSFYILSRVPQIYKNYKRHSTQGLSLEMFSFAVGGNVTYALSILFYPGHTRASFMESLPYVLGSLGTLVLDAVIFIQFLTYKR